MLVCHVAIVLVAFLDVIVNFKLVTDVDWERDTSIVDPDGKRFVNCPHLLELIVEVILADLSAGVSQLVWLVLHEWRDLLVFEPTVLEQFRIRLGILAFLSLLKRFFFASDLVDVFGLNKASVVVVEAVQAIIDHRVLEGNVGCKSDYAITVCVSLLGTDVVITDHHIVNLHSLEETKVPKDQHQDEQPNQQVS